MSNIESNLDEMVNQLTESFWIIQQFSESVTIEHQKQREPEPMWTFKDQMHKILEEIREYNFAVTSKQGDPEEHTREKCLEEGLDVFFATMTSFVVNKMTKDELRETIKVEILKFNKRGWIQPPIQLED